MGQETGCIQMSKPGREADLSGPMRRKIAKELSTVA
ncbi:hypothetical protein GGP51_000884 [Salinibacter ruber]|nr:hypothetical protein [Salinibacter ruber]